MPRPTLTRTDRLANVQAAYDRLGALLAAAESAERNPQCPDSVRFAAWEAVEAEGATIHRQSRLLAGKAKGG